MYESFLPIMSLIVIYLLIAVVSRAAKKATQAQKAASRPAHTDSGAPKGAPENQATTEPRMRELQPTVRVTGRDDSVYQGSLNAFTGEGYDPCHEEQLAPLSLAETGTADHVSPATPGLQLSWTGSEIARGFVISEILKRKGA